MAITDVYPTSDVYSGGTSTIGVRGIRNGAIGYFGAIDITSSYECDYCFDGEVMVLRATHLPFLNGFHHTIFCNDLTCWWTRLEDCDLASKYILFGDPLAVHNLKGVWR
ncbi:hypothetical protein DRP07_11705 [Archaeoglobales archaeon]|nr:MAG: hypothetical protein DRP07_11705 [Archaeoglobales archaeon]